MQERLTHGATEWRDTVNGQAVRFHSVMRSEHGTAHARNSRKGLVSLGLYSTAIVLSFFYPPASIALYVAVAVMWLVPDRGFEQVQSH